ncbi:hypothetical protein TSAR_000039 [Trichomalopsis sarcophagae]|uniref:THAP-type domain-containing protein n=1 Tax=Trichomalopsis sarcophagae TaxID=543379 RepID=A0A232EPM3_9HYME|nr:hypothetical protein TSAR_000039 [Trichomalopsis sarcophagae]
MDKPVTTYDVCKYINCNNGKLTGHRLFRFPMEANRQKIWIDNAGK